MARIIRRQRQSNPISEMNVTNLIDIGFTLLIIFMIATPLINQEQTIPVQLPVESRSDTLRPDPKTKFVIITIRDQGDYFIDQQAVTFADLKIRLRALGAAPGRENVVIRLRMDGSAVLQKLISVMDELKKNGLNKITIDTQAGS